MEEKQNPLYLVVQMSKFPPSKWLHGDAKYCQKYNEKVAGCSWK